MLVNRFAIPSRRSLALVLTPALLAALAGCSMQARPMQASRTPATPQASGATKPSQTTAQAQPPVDPSDPFAIANAPGGNSGASADPFAPWSAPNQHNASPNIFGELSGTNGASSSSDDFSENLRQITFAQIGSDFHPDISRDGKWIVFASTQHSQTSDLYIKPVGSKAVTRLTNDPGQDVMPAFSPDGRRVAFASNRNGSWDLYVMSTGGGQPIQLTADSGHELHPTWSPDGRHLAFCRLNPASNKWELWVVDSMNPGVARFIGHGLFPRWSPTGDTIAFQRSRDRGDRFFAIWTIDFVEGEAINPTEIASSPVAAFINPTWSPDGRRLAFAAVPNPHGGMGSSPDARPHASDIWMVELDGSGRSRLTGGNFVNLMPVWAPDWRLYFVSDRGGNDNIWSLQPERALIASRGEAPGVYSQRSPEQRGVNRPQGSTNTGFTSRPSSGGPAMTQGRDDVIQPGSPEAIVRGIPTPVAAPQSPPARRTSNPTNFVFAPERDTTGPEQ